MPSKAQKQTSEYVLIKDGPFCTGGDYKFCLSSLAYRQNMGFEKIIKIYKDRKEGFQAMGELKEIEEKRRENVQLENWQHIHYTLLERKKAVYGTDEVIWPTGDGWCCHDGYVWRYAR